MNKELMFKDWVKFEGRNGYFNSIGLKLTITPESIIYDSIGILNIYPITSKKEVGRCLIEVPLKEIDNLIELLKQIKDGNTL
jgi:hypothetical protein